jgi:hypothetical protein
MVAGARKRPQRWSSPMRGGSFSRSTGMLSLEEYETSADKDMARGPDVPVVRGEFSVELPPDCLVTLTGLGS